MHSLLAPGPRSMSPWMPLLDISMAMAVRARVTAHSHLFFLASAPRSEAHCDLDTSPRSSSDAHTVPNLSTCPWSDLTATEPEFDRCIACKPYITHRRRWHTTVSDKRSPVPYLCSWSEKKKNSLPACLSSLFTSFLARLCSVKHLAPIFWLVHFNQRI